jgi:addiction module HigA family antidote
MATKRKPRDVIRPRPEDRSPAELVRELDAELVGELDFRDWDKPFDTFATAAKPRRQAFPPGDHIREEIEFRGWTQGDLASIMGRPLQVVNQIINGKKAITARTAYELEAALGPSAETWMNLETGYRLYQEGQADPEISARARQRARDAEKARDAEPARKARGRSGRPRSKAGQSN